MGSIFDSFLDETDSIYEPKSNVEEEFKDQNAEIPIDSIEDLYSSLDESDSYSQTFDNIGDTDNPFLDEEDELMTILSEESLENITDISYDDIYDETDIGDSSHLRLADENLDTTKTFTTFIESKLQYPCLLIEKDNFVRAQIENLFSMIESGTTPLVINCKNQMEKIHSVQLTPDTIINLQRIFKTDVHYLEDENTNKAITPLDLIDKVAIELDL